MECAFSLWNVFSDAQGNLEIENEPLLAPDLVNTVMSQVRLVRQPVF